MAQQPGSIPKYFSILSTFRFFAQTMYITTAVLQSRTTNKLMDMDSWQLLSIVGIEAYDRRLLRAAYYLESLYALAASVWAWMNIITEATETTRRSGLKWCFRVDLVGTVFTVISLILQATARDGTQCNGDQAADTIDLGPSRNLGGANDWCLRFDDNFNLTIVMLILCAVPLYLESRWLYHKRLAESRAVSDDWTKNHSDRRQPYLKLLQRAAAPFRFFWRCCCKLGHSSKNPTAWAILYGFCLVPLIIAVGIQLFIKGLKLGIKGIRKTIKWTDIHPDGKHHWRTLARAQGGTEMACVTSKDDPATTSRHAPSMTVQPSHALSESLPDIPENASDAAAPSPVILPPGSRPTRPTRARNSKPKKSSKNPIPQILIGTFPLADLLAQPNLFFELISHLHGADLRVLSKLSKTIRSIVLSHRSTHGKAMQSYICSRRPPSPIDLSNIRSPTTLAQLTSHPLSNVPTTPTLVNHEDVPPKAACWGCGIRICGSCAKPKSNLRLSRTEIRLRYLEPVCNSCYFRCLCGPAFVLPRPKSKSRTKPEVPGLKRKRNSEAADGETPIPDPSQVQAMQPAPSANATAPSSATQASNTTATTTEPINPTSLRKIFPSLSAKCLCTIPKPPSGTKHLCRNCEKRHLTDLWKLRVRRGARIEMEELPVNLSLGDGVGDEEIGAGADAGSDTDDGDDDDDVNRGDDPVLDRNGNGRHINDEDASTQRDHHLYLPHKPPRKPPASAFTRTHCIACHQRLHLLHLSTLSTIHPLSLVGQMLGNRVHPQGKTRGLRWWRCRRCGLEARDTLMSLGREFP